MTPQSTSIRRLRALILIFLVLGVTVFTGVMFALVQRLSQRFGPQVREDLEWRALRGARELANTADIGLATGDRAMTEESFGAFRNASDVAALIAVDNAGSVVAQYGAFTDTGSVLAGPPDALIVGPGWLASWAPASIEGNAVGRVAVVVSTARLEDAGQALDQVEHITIAAGAAVLVLGCIVVLFFTRAVSVRDRQLHDYALNLEQKVDERTRELDERNRGMRRVLDNVRQGFITIDTSGVIASERSAIVERWFGAIQDGTKLADLLAASAPSFATWLELGLDSLRDGFLPVEVCLEQMPKRFESESRTFDVAYAPIGCDDHIESILVIVSDVTAECERMRSEREQREIVELFQRITSDRAGFDEFFGEASDLVAILGGATDIETEKRLVHTLKGNCGLWGVHSLVELCHAIESEMAERGEGLANDQRTRIADSWARLCERLSGLVGHRRSTTVEIERADVLALLDSMHHGATSRQLAAEVATWLDEPIAVRFERLGRQAAALGRRLGRADISIAIDDQRIRLAPERWVGFWSAMAHAVRNAVDHGIETPDERAIANKPPDATIALVAHRERGFLTIELSDDGRGVDWNRVRELAERRGLHVADDAALAAALFADGVTTRSVASDVSGRGVGLGALRTIVEELGGTIEIRSERGRGTTLSCTFPVPDACDRRLAG